MITGADPGRSDGTASTGASGTREDDRRTDREGDRRGDPEIDRSPARHSSAASVTVGLLGTAALSLGSIEGAGVALLGTLLLGGGLWIGRRRLVTIGAIVAGTGIVVAGVLGGPPEPLLVSAFCIVLAWDLAETAIDLGRTVGRTAPTRRFEAVHAAGSLAVGTVTIAVGYGTYLAVGGGQPVTALVLLLFGAVLLVSTLR